MLPEIGEILLYILLGIIIFLVSRAVGSRHKKLGYIVETVAGAVAVFFLFYQNGFADGLTLFSFLSSGYLAAFLLFEGRGKYEELKKELQDVETTEITLGRNRNRLLIDISISLIAMAGAILFLIYGPDASVLKFFILYGMVSAVAEMVKRIVTFVQVKVCYAAEEENLYILSPLKARKFPLKDIKEVETESSPDVLKLHPFLTLFTTNSDFTTGMGKVIKLSFPGEMVFSTIKETEKWQTVFRSYLPIEQTEAETLAVLPFYHRKNIKRLIGKLYFAMTVKGISAYSGLLLILYYFEAPAWLMISAALAYWSFNLYISDRVLKVGMDARRVTDPEINAVAEKVFARAGVSGVALYEAESAEYNGLAIGMNIGRSMVTLTTATMKLPLTAIEGILAHEAVHVKKRDVMWGQIWRMALLLILFFSLYWSISSISNIEAYTWAIFVVVWFIMLLFPVYQSFYSQWMEVRADHAGAGFLDGRTEQMAESLKVLALRQDEAMAKAFEYSNAKNEKKLRESSLERPSWWLRILEFQFMPHPPMYWRIHALSEYKANWGRTILRQWMADRWKESLPKGR